MNTGSAVAIYVVSMACANMSVAAFGAWISPINSFLFIGLDLSIRDYLHVRISAKWMAAVIAATGLVTYAINPAAEAIAIASSASFMLAAVVDWSVFSSVRGPWIRRANASNVVGAAVDSFAFPYLAFGALMPWVVAGQFAAKVAGGAVWSLLLNRRAQG